MEGKLNSVLRLIAKAAATHISRTQSKNRQDPVTRKSIIIPRISSFASSLSSHSSSLEEDKKQTADMYRKQQQQELLEQRELQRRDDPVRRKVRELIVRYPLILGTKLSRISERFASAEAVNADWSAYIKILRQSPKSHENFMLNQERLRIKAEAATAAARAAYLATIIRPNRYLTQRSLHSPTVNSNSWQQTPVLPIKLPIPSSMQASDDAEQLTLRYPTRSKHVGIQRVGSKRTVTSPAATTISSSSKPKVKRTQRKIITVTVDECPDVTATESTQSTSSIVMYKKKTPRTLTEAQSVPTVTDTATDTITDSVPVQHHQSWYRSKTGVFHPAVPK